MSKDLQPAWSVSAREFYREPTKYDLSYLPTPVIRKAFRSGTLHRLAVKTALKMKKEVPFDVAQPYSNS